jgi:hypothetical protein
LCFRGVGLGDGDGVGEIFFRFGEAVGGGLGVAFFVELFLYLRFGAGVGVAKIFLIFVPNDSSVALASARTVLNNSATIKSHFTNRDLLLSLLIHPSRL